MFHIVLIEPEIPHNAGAAGRLALATDSTLHLVEPLGFSLEDKYVRRTGLDYWQEVRKHVWKYFDELRAAADPAARFWYLSTKASTLAVAGGIPARRLSGLRPRNARACRKTSSKRRANRRCASRWSPGGTRSLNLSTAIAIVLYEAVRQQDPAW